MAFRCTIEAVPTVQRDDDEIRITRWDFAPGAVTGVHTHGWPYSIVMLTDSLMRIDDGTEVTERRLAAGDAYVRPAGICHDVMNGGETPMAFVEVEVKQPGALQFAVG